MNSLPLRRPLVALGAVTGVAVLTLASAHGQTYTQSLSVPVTVQVTNLPAGTTCTPTANGSTIVLDCGATPGPAPSAPTGCVATVNGGSSASLASSGGTVSLAVASCSPASGLTYSWSKNSVASASTATWNSVLPANTGSAAITTSYQVQVCNGAACATFPQSPLTATVAGVQGGAWNGTCPGFKATRVFTLGPASSGRTPVSFGPDDVLVIEMTTGTGTGMASISVSEWTSERSSRIARLSSTPCDFSTQAAPGANVDDQMSVTMDFVVGSGNTWGYYPLLLNSSKYYLNLKNSASAACRSTGVCDVFFEPHNLK